MAKWFQRKNSEWDKISSKFNASHDVNQRTCTQLKSFWENMKSRTTSAVAKDRREKAKLVEVHKQIRLYVNFPVCIFLETTKPTQSDIVQNTLA